jgi:hypothetical protein
VNVVFPLAIAVAVLALVYGLVGKTLRDRERPRFDPDAHPDMSARRKAGWLRHQRRQDWAARNGQWFTQLGLIALVVAIIAAVVTRIR